MFASPCSLCLGIHPFPFDVLNSLVLRLFDDSFTFPLVEQYDDFFICFILYFLLGWTVFLVLAVSYHWLNRTVITSFLLFFSNREVRLFIDTFLFQLVKLTYNNIILLFHLNDHSGCLHLPLSDLQFNMHITFLLHNYQLVIVNVGRSLYRSTN